MQYCGVKHTRNADSNGGNSFPRIPDHYLIMKMMHNWLKGPLDNYHYFYLNSLLGIKHENHDA